MDSLKKILFVCTGNMVRSPFAEVLAQKTFEERSLDEYVCDSAGISALEGNRAVKDAVIMAREMSVDISEHRSKPLTETLLQGSYLVLVMEKFQKNQIEALFPNHRDKIHLLSECLVGEKGGFDILDPVGNKIEYFRSIYAEISRCVLSLAERLENDEGL
jgi:protein-tyrosine phosphatase